MVVEPTGGPRVEYQGACAGKGRLDSTARVEIASAVVFGLLLAERDLLWFFADWFLSSSVWRCL